MSDQTVEGHLLYGMLPAENEPIHTRERKPAVPVAPERVETPGSFSAESLSPQRAASRLGGSDSRKATARRMTVDAGCREAASSLSLERRWFVWLSAIEDLAE